MSKARRRVKLLKRRRAGGKIPLDEGDRRLIEVQDRLLRGQQSMQIQRELSDLWTVDERTIRTYMKKVRDAIQEDSKGIDPVFERGRARAQMDELYKTAREKLDFRTCANLLRLRLQTLPGGIAPQEIHLSGPDGGPVPVAAAASIELSNLSEIQLRQLQGISEVMAHVPIPGTERKD